MSLHEETQAASSQRMYTARADGYDDSHHPTLSRRFMAVAGVRPGERALVLCCGTGLEVVLAAEAGAAAVVGVDITDAMLAKARAKIGELQGGEEGGGDGGSSSSSSRIHLFAGDVTRLDETVPELLGQTFDAVVCCSAFVLFAEPEKVLVSWRRYLAEGRGRLVVDVPHERNLMPSLLLERAARRLPTDHTAAAAYPSNRVWVEDKESFPRMLRRAGYAVEEAVVVLDGISGRGDVEYGAERVDELFEQAARSSLTAGLAVDGWVEEVRPLFREEWDKAAVGGKVESVDAVYVYVARAA